MRCPRNSDVTGRESLSRRSDLALRGVKPGFWFLLGMKRRITCRVPFAVALRGVKPGCWFLALRGVKPGCWFLALRGVKPASRCQARFLVCARRETENHVRCPRNSGVAGTQTLQSGSRCLVDLTDGFLDPIAEICIIEGRLLVHRDWLLRPATWIRIPLAREPASMLFAVHCRVRLRDAELARGSCPRNRFVRFDNAFSHSSWISEPVLINSIRAGGSLEKSISIDPQSGRRPSASVKPYSRPGSHEP